MAERSNATSRKNKEAAQDVSALQKRGRRRLVGAIALVLIAVIVLPMVFDPEPKPSTPPVSIRIPSEEGTTFTPKAVPKPAPVQPTPSATPPEQQSDARPQDKTPSAPIAKVEGPSTATEPPKAPEPAPKLDAKPAAKAPAVKPIEKAATSPKPAEKKTAAAPAEKKANAAPAVASGEKLFVQVGAFGSADKVKEVTDQLKDARLAHYTESIATAKGSVTRVRLGPFSSKEAAEKARERARSLGLNPTNPVTVTTPAAKSTTK